MGKKFKTSVAIEIDLLNWVKLMVKKKRFANVSHAVEFSLERLKEVEERGLDFMVDLDRITVSPKKRLS